MGTFSTFDAQGSAIPWFHRLSATQRVDLTRRADRRHDPNSCSQCMKVLAVNSQISNARADLQELCQRFRVERLELFGSATRDDFDPDRSDFDFLVEFLPLQPGRT